MNSYYNLLLLVIIVFVSCEERTHFEEPQPHDKRLKNDIKTFYQGEYLNSEKNLKLVIESTLIYQSSMHDSAIGDSNVVFSTDTLFQLSEKEFVKGSRGYVFLSYKLKEGVYESYQLALRSDGLLSVQKMKPSSNKLNDINKLLKLEELQDDSVQLVQANLKKANSDIVQRRRQFDLKNPYIKIK